MSQFGTALREARKSAGKTLAEVSGACGYSVSYLSDIERGTRNAPGSDEKIGSIEKFLGMERDSLLLLASKQRSLYASTVLDLLEVIDGQAEMAKFGKEFLESYRSYNSLSNEEVLTVDRIMGHICAIEVRGEKAEELNRELLCENAALLADKRRLSWIIENKCDIVPLPCDDSNSRVGCSDCCLRDRNSIDDMMVSLPDAPGTARYSKNDQKEKDSAVG